jgi:hypothetical protein
MKKLLFIAIITIVSFGAGWFIHDVKIEFAYSDNKNQHSFTEIIPYINHRIPKENLSACYEFNGQTVGDVLASVIDLNRINKINKMHFNCIEQTCFIGTSSCNKYKSSECGSRVLQFDRVNNKIIESSFQCLDIP